VVVTAKFTLTNSAALQTPPGVAATLIFQVRYLSLCFFRGFRLIPDSSLAWQARDLFSNILTSGVNITLNATLTNVANASVSWATGALGTYTVTYQSSVIGSYGLIVSVGALPVAGSPYVVLVTNPGFSSTFSTVSGATTEGIVGDFGGSRITVILRDSFQNPFLYALFLSSLILSLSLLLF
jgi:hypothetical protein